MSTLTVGRVGLDVVLTNPISSIGSTGSFGRRQEQISGFLDDGTTLAETKALRSELLEQAKLGIPIAVTSSDDPDIDGFYYLTSVDIDTSVRVNSLTGTGFFPFTINLERIGGVGQVEFQSMMTGTAITNAFGLIEAEAEPFHAPPQGALSYSAGTTTVTAGSRTGSDGAIPVFFGLDFAADPTWSVTPANYYKGAVSVDVSGRLRAGRDAPNDITDTTGWELSNTLVRVTPSATAGRIAVAHHDGTQWETIKDYKLVWNDTDVIPSWHYVSVVQNDPARATLMLVRDAAENPPTAYRHILYLTLRRGSRFVECVYHWTGGAIVLRVGRNATEASSVMDTPTGATGPLGIRATSNDGDGNRFVVGTNVAHTNDLTNGTLVTTATANVHRFFIGSEIGGTGAAANDDDTDLQLQWVGQFNERTRAVLR